MPSEVSRTIKRLVAAPIRSAFLLALASFAGCSGRTGDGAAAASNPALYGPPQGVPSTSIPRLHAMESNNEDWTRAGFACLQTELSPATLFHSSTKYLGFFTHLAEHGLGAPAFAAFNTPTGPKIYTNGEPMDVKWVEENWVLVWFSGAKGWTNWDSPWVVYLQHKPSVIRLDQSGLHFELKESAGDVVLMPLYGYEKGPPTGKAFLAAHGHPDTKIKTWEWVRAIPREPLMRVKYWACATREFPIYCEDSFSVNRATDTVTIRQRFQWHSIDDDWNTRHIKVAPVSPPLGLASMDKQFPVEFSRPVMDFALFTPHGPYMGVENADTFDANFKVLQSINEAEACDPPQTTNHPEAQAALDRLRQTAREKFSRPGEFTPDGDGGGDLWYAKGLPYYDDATRTNALTSLRKHFHDEVLATNRLDLLETLWAYAHFTGDWDLIKERWNMVRQLPFTPVEARWVGRGRNATAESDDEGAPCLAMARMAYKVGDMDTYNYACYVFARALVHHHVKKNGAAYYRQHQPWHSTEFMDTNESPARLGGVAAPGQFPASPSEVIAKCISVLRASHPTRYERLIPAGEPTPFVAGLEREVSGPNPYLVQALLSQEDNGTGTSQAIWPEVTWARSWATPNGRGWSFGRVTPSAQGMPSKVQVMPLNWNTEAFVYAVP